MHTAVPNPHATQVLVLYPVSDMVHTRFRDSSCSTRDPLSSSSRVVLDRNMFKTTQKLAFEDQCGVTIFSSVPTVDLHASMRSCSKPARSTSSRTLPRERHGSQEVQKFLQHPGSLGSTSRVVLERNMLQNHTEAGIYFVGGDSWVAIPAASDTPSSIALLSAKMIQCHT